MADFLIAASISGLKMISHSVFTKKLDAGGDFVAKKKL